MVDSNDRRQSATSMGKLSRTNEKGTGARLRTPELSGSLSVEEKGSVLDVSPDWLREEGEERGKAALRCWHARL